MDRVDRIVLLCRMFAEMRGGLTIERMMGLCDCSKPTLYKDLDYIRGTLQAPLVHDGGTPRSYYFEPHTSAPFQFTSLWLGPQQIYGLRLAQLMFADSGAEFLSAQLEPAQVSARKAMAQHTKELSRVRILRCRGRKVLPPVFRAVSQATFERLQLRFEYRSRSTGKNRERLVSPQLLTHYRDNWYLDAWDHRTHDLRVYSIDRIRNPAITEQPAVNRPEAELQAHLDAGYGIFAGPVIGKARIWFSPEARQWVEDEHWHDGQKQHFHPDGSMELVVPYANMREIVMDVLRFGENAEVLGPAELREEMKRVARGVMRRYG